MISDQRRTDGKKKRTDKLLLENLGGSFNFRPNPPMIVIIGLQTYPCQNAHLHLVFPHSLAVVLGLFVSSVVVVFLVLVKLSVLVRFHVASAAATRCLIVVLWQVTRSSQMFKVDVFATRRNLLAVPFYLVWNDKIDL